MHTIENGSLANIAPFISPILSVSFGTPSKQVNRLLQTHQVKIMSQEEVMSFGKQLEGALVGPRITDNWLSGQESLIPSASQGTVVSVNTVQGIVQRQLTGKFASDPGIRFGDGTYYLPTIQEVREILSKSQADRRTWLAERFDCDDFAYVLKGEMSIHAYDTGDIRYGLCVGMVWGNFAWVKGYHAVNWFIASDGALRFIEPQNDSVYDVSQCQGAISLLIA